MLNSMLKWVLLLMISCTLSPLVRSQMLGCYFQEVNLLPCLSQPITGNITEVCCIALNAALRAGHRCACSVLASTNLLVASVNPLLISPLALPLPGCLVSSPSLAACQVPLQQLSSPPAPDTKPLLSPIAGAPAPNSTQARKSYLRKEVPRSSDNNIAKSSFGKRGESSDGRRKMGSMPLVALLAAVSAWIL